MRRLRQPRTPQKLVPVISDDDTRKILDTCKGKDLIQVRDEAIIRMLYNTGARLSEVANLRLDDVDLALDSVRYHGKGAKDRRVRFGPKTGRALSRYLRVRADHPGGGLAELWLRVHRPGAAPRRRAARPARPGVRRLTIRRDGHRRSG